MQDKEKFSWRKRGESFRYAWSGIGKLLREEHNARIHLGVTVAVLVAGFLFGLAAWEWTAIVICIGMVFAGEAFNSAVEAVCDRFGAERHPLIGKAKDVAAAGVLFLAAAAATVGLIIFLPRLIDLS